MGSPFLSLRAVIRVVQLHEKRRYYILETAIAPLEKKINKFCDLFLRR